MSSHDWREYRGLRWPQKQLLGPDQAKETGITSDVIVGHTKALKSFGQALSSTPHNKALSFSCVRVYLLSEFTLEHGLEILYWSIVWTFACHWDLVALSRNMTDIFLHSCQQNGETIWMKCHHTDWVRSWDNTCLESSRQCCRDGGRQTIWLCVVNILVSCPQERGKFRAACKCKKHVIYFYLQLALYLNCRNMGGRSDINWRW